MEMLEDRQFTGIPKGKGPGGTHGWDDTSPLLDEYEEGPMPDMRGVFMARGPGIAADNKVTDWIKLVDEYQLFCYLLGIQPEQHNGTWARVQGFLRNPPTSANVKIALHIAFKLKITFKCLCFTIPKGHWQPGQEWFCGCF